jgi:hypothetical protein|tara:strand:+ start:132 stop:524 length:393 start_codon:yes stop_codon:yes gene_type:complete
MSSLKTTKFTIQEYAKTFSVSVSKVRKDIKSGKIQAEKDGGRWVVFCDSDTIPQSSTDDTLLQMKDEQIQMLQEQLDFLKTTLQQTITDHQKTTDQFQQVILSQNMLLDGRKLSFFDRIRSIFNFRGERV